MRPQRGNSLDPRRVQSRSSLRSLPFPAILDRNEEIAAAIRALESQQSVELFGEAGIGKTVVLRHLAYTINSKLFQDGIIYREIRGVPP